MADPDGLLRDEQFTRTLAARGQAVVAYEDAIAFRLTWQALRRSWEAGAEGELVVSVAGGEDAARALPFDLVVRARVVTLRKADVFSGVPSARVTALPLGELDRLDRALAKTPPSREAVLPVEHMLDRARRIHALLGELEGALPGEEAGWQTWTSFAARWGRLQADRFEESEPRWEHERSEALHDAIEARFVAWMDRHYANLPSLPPEPPAMLHHVPRAMARAREGSRGRVALVVMDGMAFDQWLVLRESMRLDAWCPRSHTAGVFAWVPTTTVISRQALFAGKTPRNIAGALSGTSQERSLWEAFWSMQRPAVPTVGYMKGLGDSPLEEIQSLLDDPRVGVLGAVVDKVDRIMHGLEMGMAGMHEQVRLWARSGWLEDFLRRLLATGFEVFLTADHGNLEAVGTGRLQDGVIAETRGERVRVFRDPSLRATIAREAPQARVWSSVGLSADHHVLVAAGRSAFVAPGERVVVHGGVSLEEVVVPLVRLSP